MVSRFSAKSLNSSGTGCSFCAHSIHRHLALWKLGITVSHCSDCSTRHAVNEPQNLPMSPSVGRVESLESGRNSNTRHPSTLWILPSLRLMGSTHNSRTGCPKIKFIFCSIAPQFVKTCRLRPCRNLGGIWANSALKLRLIRPPGTDFSVRGNASPHSSQLILVIEPKNGLALLPSSAGEIRNFLGHGALGYGLF